MRVKYAILIFGILVLVNAFLAFAFMYNGSTAVTSVGNNSYSVNGVSFKSPDNWHVFTTNDLIVIAKNESDDTPVFSIQIVSNPWDISDQEAMNALQNTSDLEGTTLISNGTITFNGATAYKQIYTLNDSNKFKEIVKEQEISFVKNGNTYILEFQAPLKDFDKEKPNMDIILNSFKLQ
jgi:hypothetical protein